MPKYKVILKRVESYEVIAPDEDAAIDIACRECDDDPNAWSWMNPVDEFIVEEI